MTGNSLDPHIVRYAQRTSGMRASAIRALFAVANRPEVVSLAGGMPYIEVAAAGRTGRRRRADGRPGRPGRPAVRLRPGHPAATRADLRDDVAGRDRRPPRRRRGHRRLADGPRSGDPDVLRSRRRHSRRGPLLRRSARHLRRLSGAGGARRHGRRRSGAGGARGRDRLRAGRPAGRSSSCTRSPTTTTRRRDHVDGAPAADRRRSVGTPASSSSRTIPTDYWVSTTPCTGPSGPTTPATWSTSARSPRRSLRGCGSAGCSPRTPCGRSWYWPTSLRCSTRRCSTR